MHIRMLLVALFSILALSLAGEALAAPQLAIRSPLNRAEVTDSSVTVEFDVSDITLTPPTVPWEQAGTRGQENRPDQGHLLLMLDLWPPVVWDKQEPYTFQNVPPGEHELKVELVNNDHTSMSPPIVQTVRFRSTGPAPAMLPNGGIADLAPMARQIAVFGLGGVALALAGAGLLRRTR
jgi:hypothetical protein